MNARATPTLRIEIDGRPVDAPRGSTIAAALGLGASRTSVSGQPRAPLCGMGVCHECRVQVDGIQQLACMTPCREGQAIRTGDARLQALPTGDAAPPEQRCDLLVIGAGPAGLQAALAAAPSGARITVLDDNPAPGGQIWRSGPRHRAPGACQGLLDELARHPNVVLVSGASVVGLAGDRALLVETARQGWTQRFAQAVLCTGARERLLPFPGWTLPGVTGAGGLQALIKQGLDVRGQRIVIAGSGPLLLAAAASARRAGARVMHVAEQAAWAEVARFAAVLWRWPAKAWQAATLFDPGFRPGAMVVAAQGGGRLQSVTLRTAGGDRQVPCERLACGWGLVPRTRLAQLMGCALDAQGAIAVDARQQTSVAGLYAAGECTGIGGNERARLQGRIAGYCATSTAEAPPALARGLAHWNRFATLVQDRFALREAATRLADATTLVCRCEDVALGALEDCDGWVQAKLQTRCGMGACQGRICGTAAQALRGWTPTPPRQLTGPARIATLAALTERQ